MQLYEAFTKLKKDNPDIMTVIGGPHATYFPEESAKVIDFVVMSEGFGALNKILRGVANKGILSMEGTERFPHPDRKTFYEEYPEHANSRIKSFITMTGCPYKCTYCYNSSEPEDIAAPPEIIEKVKKGLALNISNQKKMKVASRLFPYNIRSIDDVIMEASEIAETWPTQVLYCQDDVHGFDIKEWMPNLASRWKKEVGIPYHAQMRWEMTKDEKRLDLLREAGCFGLTLAIEAADSIIRREVLSRDMKEEIIFNGMKKIIDKGFKVRTEQITGLPYGATTKKTAMNLDADLGLVEFNVRLRKETGGPTMAWASTLAPYRGTKLGQYCETFGHYMGNNNDVPDTFFERSVLRFPKEWIGPELEQIKNNPLIWLSELDLEKYRDQNAELRRHFNFFTMIPDGHKLAESYLKSSEPFGYERLGRETEEHISLLAQSGNAEATKILNELKVIRGNLQSLNHLTPYFACLPKSKLAVMRTLKYSSDEKDSFDPQTLSTAVRHHLYDEVLYETINQENCRLTHERTPTKL